MKTKQQNTTIVVPASVATVTINGSGSVYTFGPVAEAIYNQPCTITYSTNPKPQFNSCDHSEVERIIALETLVLTDMVNNHTWSMPSGRLQSYYYGSSLGADSVAGPSYDHAFLMEQAWSSMRPSMGSGFSLPNFIREAHEIRQLHRVYHDGANALRSVVNGLRATGYAGSAISKDIPVSQMVSSLLGAKRLALRSISKIAKSVGSAFLNIMFGWRPLIRDVQTVMDALRRFEREFEQLKQNAGKRQVLHFKRYIPHDPATSSTSVSGDGFIAMKHIKTVYQPTVFCASAYYTYVLPDVDDALLRARALADTFGVNANPAHIWNAIPYSFVVDWFVDVSTFLEQFKGEATLPNITLEDFTVSLKQETSSAVSVDTHSNGSVSPVKAGLFCGSRTIRTYRRWREIPTSYVPTNVRGLTQMQVLLGLALLNQRVR